MFVRCSAGDSDDSSSDEGEGECTGLESKWDRGCSRKMTEESCLGVRRGTVCQWVTKHSREDLEYIDHGTLPETAAFAAFHFGKMVTFGDEVVHGAVSRLHLILLIGLVLTLSAVAIQLYQWYRKRRRRMGSDYQSLFVAEKYYEEEEREYQAFSSPILQCE